MSRLVRGATWRKLESSILCMEQRIWVVVEAVDEMGGACALPAFGRGGATGRPRVPLSRGQFPHRRFLDQGHRTLKNRGCRAERRSAARGERRSPLQGLGRGNLSPVSGVRWTPSESPNRTQRSRTRAPLAATAPFGVPEHVIPAKAGSHVPAAALLVKALRPNEHDATPHIYSLAISWGVTSRRCYAIFPTGRQKSAYRRLYVATSGR